MSLSASKLFFFGASVAMMVGVPLKGKLGQRLGPLPATVPLSVSGSGILQDSSAMWPGTAAPPAWQRLAVPVPVTQSLPLAEPVAPERLKKEADGC